MKLNDLFARPTENETVEENRDGADQRHPGDPRGVLALGCGSVPAAATAEFRAVTNGAVNGATRPARNQR
ncbi:MAG: hypothetical protein H0V69_04390 [Acidimicrobiia bacterium]|nr:hypothetical protein [Acidimicrobiia bacterium]